MRMKPPMLVKTAPEPLVFEEGFIAQPKLNGVRAVAMCKRGKVAMISRRSIFLPGMNSIRSELKGVLKSDIVLDGELYKHGASLLWISGQSRRKEDEDRLEYHVFDCFDPKRPKLTAVERQSLLDSILPRSLQHVKRVKNYYPKTLREIKSLFDTLIKKKYEGLILRRRSGLYKFSINGARSSDVLRIKPKIHEEFKCIGFKQGTGKDKGAVIWICQTKDGKSFHVVPKGMTYPIRYKLFRFLSKDKNFETYLKGKPITVEFDEYSSKTGIPLRAKAETFRTYENNKKDPLRVILNHI